MSDFINVSDSNKREYNAVVDHPLQSFEWGEFRKKTGVKVARRALVKNGKIVDGFTLTLHKVPKTPFCIGYFPKGKIPSKEILEELYKVGLDENCIFIQLEPNVEKDSFKLPKNKYSIISSHRPLFTKYSFVLNLKQSEEEILENMHHKTRYNIKIAQKHGVKIIEDSSKKGFEEYLGLLLETQRRQKFYAHNASYHKQLWNELSNKIQNNALSYHLFHAVYGADKKEEKIIASWVLFVFKDKLYYPYGASSREYRQTMASNLIAWEAIRFGKKMNLSEFDMWGALSPDPNTNDPWYGFHKFKEGYGGELVEFAGSFDLIIRKNLYTSYKIMDKLRWAYLGARSFLRR